MNSNTNGRLRVALLFALNAGFLDGFSFFNLDERFIGAQSGNVVQGAISIAEGNFSKFLGFIIPMVFFILGIITRGIYSEYLLSRGKVESTHLVLVQWVGILICSFLYCLDFPLSTSLYVGIFSYFMSIQYDGFSLVRGLPYGSIFITGNMRSMVSNFSQYLLKREKKYIKNIFIYFLLIAIFFSGAFMVTKFINYFGNFTILGSPIIIGLAYFIICWDDRYKQ